MKAQRSVWTVIYFVGGTTNNYKSGILTRSTAEKLAAKLREDHPNWSVSLGYGVDESYGCRV